MRTLTPLLALALITACSPDADGDGVYAKFDCNDEDAAVFPQHAELCDGIDNDCDGQIDEQEDAVGGAVFFVDVDGDGFGDITGPLHACAAPSGYADKVGDCDDGDSTVNPDATEVCNDKDDDCDGEVDGANSSDAGTWYSDYDSDSYGNPDFSFTGCERPNGYVADDTDCDDLWPEAYPGGTEVCDRHDNDCNGEVDEDAALDARDWYYDGDSDGYGDAAVAQFGCWPDAGYVDLNTDCDDTTDLANPGIADETCNDGLDNNCNGEHDGCAISGLVGAHATASAEARGESSSDYLGQYGVDIVGDIDGDGYDDIAAGAYGNDGGASSGGAAYLLYGSATPDTSTPVAVYGTHSSDYVGRVLAGLGDVDGDGYDDWATGAYGYDYGGTTYTGGVFLFHGSSTRLTSGAAETQADALFYGSSDYAGYDVAAAGDVNGDGYDDFMVGGYYFNSYRGHVYLMYGSSTGFSGDTALSGNPTFVGINTSDYVGKYYSQGYADLNGDGYSDIGLGTYGYDSPTSSSGAVWIFEGSSTDYSGGHTVSSADTVISHAADAGADGDAYLGWVVAHAGDPNGDGYEDLLVTGYYYNGTVGGVSVEGGGAFLYMGSSTGLAADIDTSDADVAILGEIASDYVGYSGDGVGDVNGDGFDDIVVGAYQRDVSASGTGSAFVLYGNDALATQYLTSELDAEIYGDLGTSYQYTGKDVGGGGDVNGDGLMDFVVSAYGADSSAGRVYLFLGTGI